VTSSFKENLFAISTGKNPIPILKIVFCRRALSWDAINDLHYMNISQQSLFPDLGGFARSLETKILIPELLELRPENCEKSCELKQEFKAKICPI